MKWAEQSTQLSEVKHHINVQVEMDELDLTAAESMEVLRIIEDRAGNQVSS